MITFDKVSFGYGTGFTLKDCTFTLQKGELVTLVGPNGAGKSTLLRLAAGQLTPRKGKIGIGNLAFENASQGNIAKAISYLSQSGLHSDLPVMDVVLHGRFPHTRFPHRYGDADREIATKAIRTMGLAELAHRPLSSLSGGERQKAMIAMALCQNCNTILMDEPTAFLDPRHRVALMETLSDLAKEGKSILCVLHDLPLALRFSRRIAVMKEGELICIETPEKLIQKGIFIDVFGIEIKKSTDGFFYYADAKKDTE